MELLNETKDAHRRNELQVLTIGNARELIGKRIQILNYGYKGQDYAGDFIVGEIISEFDFYSREVMEDGRTRAEYWESFMTPRQLQRTKEELVILDADGRDTHIRYSPDYSYEGEFHLGDAYRDVFFIVAE